MELYDIEVFDHGVTTVVARQIALPDARAIWNRIGAIGITSIVFAALHATNRGISAIAIINLIIAGVLLALAYERYQRLWFPIGIHFVWNLLSGPILGYGVSGYAAETTVFRTIGSGPLLVTGGAFGIEGSVWMAVAELGGIFWLLNELRISNLELRMKKLDHS